MVVAMTAALLVPATAASAAVSTPSQTSASKPATTQPTTTQSTTNQPTTAQQATAPKPVNIAKPVPKPRTKPTPPTAPTQPKAVSKTALSQARATAAKSAIAHSSMSSTCSGAISPDVVYPCSAPSSTGTDTFTVNLADPADLLIVQVLSVNGNELPFTVTDPSGAAVSCSANYYGQIPQCATTASGTYTVAVTNQSTNYTISYLPLLSDTTCNAIDPSYAAAPVEASIAAGAVGACYTLNVPSGHTVMGNMATDTTSYLQTLLTVYDSTGAQICFANYQTCALTGTGPYRVLLDGFQGTAFSYGLLLNDLTAKTDCGAATQQAYGVAPDDTSVNQCRKLTVTTAGEYQVYAATNWQGGAAQGILYAADGTVACTNSGPFCQLSAGDYYYIEFEDPLAPYDFAVAFVAADESRGCTATGDTDFATGPAAAQFSGVGEVVCLTLPTAVGKSAYVFDESVALNSYQAPLLILDSTGAQQCTNLYNSSGTCTPTGTAPFHLLAESQGSQTGYKVIVQATDSTAGCQAWPQSGFGGSWGATATTSPVSNYACLSIPASQHSTGEMVDYADTTNTEDGGIAIDDPTGAQDCLIFTTGTCKYQAGVNYTAILSNTGQNQTYELVRRDVTQSAQCSTPASTDVGGPSTGFTLDSALDTTCYRVTAAATDDMWFDVRTLAPYPAGAILIVTDGSGTNLCMFSRLCQLTGSTDYQVITDTLAYGGFSVAAHLDTWRLATASGPAAQCQAHQLSVNGWAPVSGTLTESTTAYCATIPVQPDEDFSVVGMTSPPASTPLLGTYNLANWGTYYASVCSGFGDCFTSSATGQAVLIVSLYGGAESPTGFTIQGLCKFGCTGRPGPATISAISPAAQQAGDSDEVTVTGTNLDLGTEVMLATSGNPVSTNWISQPVSVNADGTRLTVRLDTSAVTPGLYDVMLDANYSVPTSSPNYLVGAYTVTAAPAPPANSVFVPVTPSRILNTLTGVGAPTARLAGDSTLSLRVGGAAGVPSDGLTAVAVDLTAINPDAGGYVVGYGDGTTRPVAGDISFSAGRNATNLAVVPVVNGKIDLYNASAGAVDLTADIDGYYTNANTHKGSELTTLTPTQILDSQTAIPSGPPARIPADGTTSVNILGTGGVPTSGVTAVLLNVSTLNPKAAGSLTVYDGDTRPDATNASFSAGQSVSNLAVVPIVDGEVTFHNNSSGAINLSVAVEGYYSATSTSSGPGFQPFGPQRVLDTRTGLGGSGQTVVPGGVAILPGIAGIPNTATAVVLDITVVGAQHSGTLTLLSPDLTVPPLSDVTFQPGHAISNTVVVPLTGNLEFYNNSAGAIQVIADIEGYYTA
ncbi:hypothetical protein [Actinocrinis sp.]|uniref:hypothetical protein n=1 Tax=Actinocrinis sp. TaxID=1920516 RepID=UPI002DDCF271|nr:hypothetical protein [Actinocrinis sp.]